MKREGDWINVFSTDAGGQATITYPEVMTLEELEQFETFAGITIRSRRNGILAEQRRKGQRFYDCLAAALFPEPVEPGRPRK